MNKKLGLLLLPLVPLSAIGTVEIIDHLVAPEPTPIVESEIGCRQPVEPLPQPAPQFARPPVAPQPSIEPALPQG